MMKRSSIPTKTSLVAGLAILLSGAQLQGDILNLTPSADASLFYRTGTTWMDVNYGAEQDLDNYNFPDLITGVAYVQFDLSSIPAGSTINSVTFSVTKTANIVQDPPGGSHQRNDTLVASRFNALGLLDVAGNTPQDWDEGTITWNLAGDELFKDAFAVLDPPFDPARTVNFNDLGESVSDPNASISGAGGSALVNFVQDRVNGGGLTTFMLDINETNARGYAFASKEHPTDPIPALSVDFTPVPEPGTTAAIVGLVFLGYVIRRRMR